MIVYLVFVFKVVVFNLRPRFKTGLQRFSMIGYEIDYIEMERKNMDDINEKISSVKQKFLL